MSDAEYYKKECQELSAALCLSDNLLDWIQAILNGEEVSDFALSFPIVRKVQDLYLRLEEK